VVKLPRFPAPRNLRKHTPLVLNALLRHSCTTESAENTDGRGGRMNALNSIDKENRGKMKPLAKEYQTVVFCPV
jgi:hypothetical protein